MDGQDSAGSAPSVTGGNTRPLLANGAARAIFLDRHALAEAPTGAARGAALQTLIERIGFVQIDSINTVARAHHMILAARRQSYRQEALSPLLERDRSLFEHWTHDAAMIPMRFFPRWQLRFARNEAQLADRWKTWRREGYADRFEDVLRHISDHGPACSADVGEDEERSSGGWWDWHPSKTALEFLWRTGALSVTRRDGFRKVYDLTERVIPAEYLTQQPDPEETIDWACRSGLARLGFGTSGEIAAFWALVTPQEAKTWCQEALRRGEIIEIDVECASGRCRRVFALPSVLDEVPPVPPARVRILSPFDPALRDRKRAEHLFGFHYRIEVFVPEAKRRYGYYVFPVLEGDRLIGRIDMKCRRGDGALHVRAFWAEPGVRIGKGRLQRLRSELDRMARFAGSDGTTFEADWLDREVPPSVAG